MANLKGSEKFVADSLKLYFSQKLTNVSYDEGDDPPDIYLKIDNKKISVEITDIDQNVLKNKKTIEYAYFQFINNLDNDFGKFIDNDKRILIFFYHNYIKVSTIDKKFKKYLKSKLDGKKLLIGNEIEDIIDGVNFKISILAMGKNNKKILGHISSFGGDGKYTRDINTVSERISEINILKQSLNIILNRIEDKNKKCKNLKKPVWLALYDNYYDKFTFFDNKEHLEHYKSIFDDIEDFGIFEKILIIFKNADILEFPKSNKQLELT
jgi:hypothetical protein